MYWPPATGKRAGRDLQQHVELFLRRGGIGDDDLAAVDHVDQELLGDELVDLLAVFLAEAVAVAEEVLADEDRRMLGHFGGRLDFFVIDDHRAAGRERHLRALELGLVLGRLERQIEQGQRREHLGEVVRRLGQVRREERLFGRIVCGVVAPERVDRDQRGDLLLERQVVVVALDPFHRLVELAVVLLDARRAFCDRRRRNSTVFVGVFRFRLDRRGSHRSERNPIGQSLTAPAFARQLRPAAFFRREPRDCSWRRGRRGGAGDESPPPHRRRLVRRLDECQLRSARAS